ncbi:hypothetical protein [Vallitalea okinawensis]|uniref:hypothetical protein n=1 Tax=Vallitalea okinawensis TaxID=2078660 RepID=UPI000CFDA1D7|nr:hypothetical protein [Vallitalea okinawensis]
MKKLTKIVLRIISIWLGIRTISAIILFASAYIDYESGEIMGSGVFSYGFILICVVVLWTFADKIAETILDGKDNQIESHDNQCKIYGILHVAVFILGIYFFADALPALINVTVNVMILGVEHIGDFTEGIKMNLIPQLVENLIRIIIGIVFIFSPKKILALFDYTVYKD